MTQPDNQDKFDLLQDQYGGKELIPNDVLYEFIQGIRQDLMNVMAMGTEHIPKSSLGLEVRRRCQTDLFWMARFFTWDTNPFSENGTKPISENKIEEDPHRVFCDLFIKKDPTKTIAEQHEVKTRLLLWPRGGMKSTIDHVDTVQWILCFPSIRILYLTATKDLAVKFVGEIQGHFLIREENPSLMNMFWPEHCLLEKDLGAANQFVTPVYARKKTKRREPTVIASSLGKAKAGFHYELIKADDGVSDTNTVTPEQCASVSEQLFLAEKLLDLGGYYIDYVGTRYEDGDHYDIMLEQNAGEIATREGHGWVLMENKTTGVNILIGRAIQVKPEVIEKLKNEGRPVTYHEAGEENCILLLPKVMSFKWLMNDRAKNEKIFESQRNQNPRAGGQGGFDRMTLLKATVPYTLLPRYGPISQFWDLAFSQKKGTDFSVGTSVMWGEEDLLGADGKPLESFVNGTKVREKKTVGYVRKIVRDRFNPFTVAQAIVQLAVEERPFIIGIEKAAGSQNIEPTIIAEARKTRDAHIISLCENIEWVPVDGQKDAKIIRIGALLPWFSEGRMKLANFCMQPKHSDLEILYSEFDKCLSKQHHHEDIPDCLAYQLRYAPRAYQAIIENNADMFSRFDQQGWNEVYGGDEMNAYYPDENGVLSPWGQPPQLPWDDWVPEPDISSGTPNGMPNILGAGIYG